MELLFPLLLLVPLLLLIMRQRRQQRAFVEQQGRVAVGMTVMTTAGLYGTVVDIEDDVMVLEVDDGVHLRWSKLAVGRIVDDGTAGGPAGPTSFDQGVGHESTAPPGSPPGQVDIRKDSSPRASSPGGA